MKYCLNCMIFYIFIVLCITCGSEVPALLKCTVGSDAAVPDTKFHPM